MTNPQKAAFTLRYLRANAFGPWQGYDVTFMVSGSTLLTALSRPKGYRTMDEMAATDLLGSVNIED